MTHDKWIKLTLEQKIAKVTKYSKWTPHQYLDDKFDTGRSQMVWSQPPDYLNDLNAMHEAISSLSQGQLQDLMGYLLPMMKEGPFETNEELWVMRTLRATAAQRAEAYVLTMEPE